MLFKFKGIFPDLKHIFSELLVYANVIGLTYVFHQHLFPMILLQLGLVVTIKLVFFNQHGKMFGWTKTSDGVYMGMIGYQQGFPF